MGACPFCIVGEGKTAREVFDELVEQARYEHGNDSYNGTISTCVLNRVRTIATTYSEKVKKEAQKMAESDDYGRKWEATAIDMGVCGYDIISVKKKPVAITVPAKYQTKYVVIKNYTNVTGKFDTKREADAEAIRQALESPQDDFTVNKRPVNINHGNDTLSEFEITKKRVNTKPKTVKAGTIVVPQHKYMFYGVAAI